MRLLKLPIFDKNNFKKKRLLRISKVLKDKIDKLTEKIELKNKSTYFAGNFFT